MSSVFDNAANLPQIDYIIPHYLFISHSVSLHNLTHLRIPIANTPLFFVYSNKHIKHTNHTKPNHLCRYRSHRPNVRTSPGTTRTSLQSTAARFVAFQRVAVAPFSVIPVISISFTFYTSNPRGSPTSTVFPGMMPQIENAREASASPAVPRGSLMGSKTLRSRKRIIGLRANGFVMLITRITAGIPAVS